MTQYARPLVRIFDWFDGMGDELSGWVMRGFEDLDPATGFGVAHDALEHFDNTLGGEGEMMAFGSILYGRASHNWGNAAQNGSTFGEELAQFVDEGMTCSLIKPQAELEGWAELWIESVRDAFTRNYDSNWPFPGSGESSKDCDALFQNFANWMRKGYRKAAHRWVKRGGTSMFLDMFNVIADSAKHDGEVGDKLRVRIYAGCRGCTVDRWVDADQEWQ